MFWKNLLDLLLYVKEMNLKNEKKSENKIFTRKWILGHLYMPN